MALPCIYGARECDGTCSRCHTEPVPIGHCVTCKEPITIGDDYYEIGDDLIHEDCLHEWSEQYRVAIT